MEAITTVGGAVLASLFQTLFDRLKSSDLITYARERKVLEEINKWEVMLKTISVVVEKAEEQQLTDLSVKSWFNDLRNLSYDMEDILDEFNTDAMRRKFHADSGGCSSKVHKLLQSSVVGLSFSSRIKFSCSMISKMKIISKRLGVLITQKDILKLCGNTEGRDNRMEETPTLPTTSLVHEAPVYGREKDHKAILELMKRQSDERISVIPLVGMGGIGKTTLAQLVYNDASLQFDFKAWVSVGEDFNVLTVIDTILLSAGCDEKKKDLNYLQVKLWEELSRKKCLIVLDDLWSQDYQKWTLFFGPFAEGTAGSRILITTRNQEVSLMTSGGDGYLLKELSYDDCLSVFAQHSLGRKDFREHLYLKKVGEKIVEKCDGLPLAAKALGGILRGKQNTRSWEEVLNSRIWEERGIVLPALKLSYYHLPSILKRCFGYTSIFNKNYEFDKTRLVLLWMAEGFIQRINDGYKHFDDLVARSLIQQSSKNASFFVMHDLINDLARSVSGNICFNLDEEMQANKSCSEVRHSGFGCSEYDIARRFEIFHDMTRLRTFLPLRLTHQGCFLSHTVLDAIVPKLVRLRVLELPYHGIVELPTSIGELMHLRHLSLAHSQIKTLPETLCTLLNLQTLILAWCTKLLKLPKDFCCLINLQCLDIEGTESLREMPPHIGNLTKLHILSKFVVGDIDGCGIKELQKIPDLQGKLHIGGLQHVKDIQDAEYVKMKERDGIVHLEYSWTNDLDDVQNERDEQVLIALQPQKSTASLSIKSYGGAMFPSWLGDHAFDHMTFLKLSNCGKVSLLPPLGQLPLLEYLRIEGMSAVKEVGMEFYGKMSSSKADVFPSLQTLLIENMKEWKRWSCNTIDEHRRNAFPKLKELKIKSSLKLSGQLPNWLPALQQLHIGSCPILEVAPEILPSLEELVISGCDEVVLKSFSHLRSLTVLEISHISSLARLDKAFLEGLVSLQEMDVKYCDELKHLWEDRVNINRLKHLKQLKIWCCRELVSLVEGDEGILPPNLQVLNIDNCPKLEKLPNQLHSLTSLQALEVNQCPKLVIFSTGGLPPVLERLGIQNCDSLTRRLPEAVTVGEDGNLNTQGTSHIEKILISKYEGLGILSNGGFPTKLNFVGIINDTLAHLLGSLQMQNYLSHLTHLTLYNCEELKAFPNTGLPTPALKSLELLQCRKLRCLPNHMHNLTCLQRLHLVYCSEIRSFREGGLPPNLTLLCVSNCEKLERQPLSDWKLSRLSSLGQVIIKGGMQTVSSFDSLLFPDSLTSLSVAGFRNLKSISDGFRRLESVKTLWIEDCPKLQYLPREGLPPSLEFLSICKCPLLQKRYRKERGKYWPLIAPIPYVHLQL